MTWANQVRILKQSFEQLAAIIGGALINAFKPLVRTLNSVLQKVISFATAVTEALGTIFGWKYEVGSGGVTQDWTDDMEDLTDATDDATDSTKELKKQIMSFDEIHALNDNSSGSSDSSDTSGTGSSDGLSGALVRTDSIFDKYKSDIDSLYKLGEYISKAIRNALADIDWDSVYSSARNFGTGLAEFLNGLIRPDTFYQIGRTIANCLNTAIYAGLAFAETLDWKNVGESIAAAINGFFYNFDAKSFAQSINKWVQGIFTMIMTAIKNIKWSEIAKRIGDFLDNIEIKTVAIIIGALTIKKILSLHLVSTVLSQIAKAVAADLTTAIVTKLGASEAKTVGAAIWAWIKRGITTSTSASKLAGVSIGTVLSSSLTAFTGLATEFTLVSRAMEQVTKSGEVTAGTIAEIGVAGGIATAAIAAIGALNPFTPLTIAAVGFIGGLNGINKAFEEMELDTWYSAVKNMGNVTVDEITAPVIQSIQNMTSEITIFKDEFDTITETQETAKTTATSINLISSALENGAYTAEDKIPEILSLMQELCDETETIFNKTYDFIVEGIGGALGDAVTAVGDSVAEMTTEMYLAKSNGDEYIAGLYQNIAELQKKAQETGTLTEEEFAQLNEYYTKLRDVLGNTSEEMQNLQTVLNTAQFLTANKSTDTETFAAQLSQVTDAYHTAIDASTTYALEFQAEYDSFLSMVKSMADAGDETAQKYYESLQSYDISSYISTYITQQEEKARAEIQSAGEQMQTGIINQITGIAQSAVDKWDEMSEYSKAQYGNNIKEFTAVLIEDWITEHVEPLEDEIQKEYNDVGIEGGIWASDAAWSIYNSFLDTELPEGEYSDTVTSYFEGELSEIGTNVSKTASDTGEDISNSFADSVSGTIIKAQDAMEGTYVEAADDTIDAYEDTIKGRTDGTVIICEQYADESIDAIEDTAKSRQSGTKDIMNDYGESFTDSLNTGMNSLSSQTSSIVNAIADSLPTPFSGLSSSFLSIGEDIMSGLYNGIASIGSKVITKASEIASSVAEKISSVLKVGSPSKVMYEIGGWTMEGFNLGMQSVYDDILETVADTGYAVAEMPSLDSLVDATANLNVDTNYGSASAKAIQNGSASSNGEIVSLLRELINVSKNGSTITIDGREIGRTSVDYINSQTRRGTAPLLSY